MKRVLGLLLCAALLLSGCAYAAAEQRQENVYDLYFLESDLSTAAGKDALRAEPVYLEGAGTWRTSRLAAALVNGLIQGPADGTLKSTLPAGTTLLSLEVRDTRAQVDMSPSYRTLSGVALTLADYAITMTLTQLSDIDSVSITVRGQELAYRDVQSFSARDLLLASNEDVVGTVTATLYFPTETGVLTPETRTLDLYEGDTQVAAVVEALEGGPDRKGLVEALPEGFQVKSVWLEDDVCYVNLPRAALETMTADTPLETALRALTWSLRSVETVGEVRFLVDGEFAAYYGPVAIADLDRVW